MAYLPELYVYGILSPCPTVIEYGNAISSGNHQTRTDTRVAKLTVGFTALDASGKEVSAVGAALGTVLGTLSTVLKGTVGMSGIDPTGIKFGQVYDQVAFKLIEAVTTVCNGVGGVGYGMRVSSHNYQMADLESDIFKPSAAPAPPEAPVKMDSAFSTSAGHGIPALPGFSAIAPIVGEICPTGDPIRLRVASGAWNVAATALEGGETAGLAAVLANPAVQAVPEGKRIDSSIKKLESITARSVVKMRAMSVHLLAYATAVDMTRTAVLPLLATAAIPVEGEAALAEIKVLMANFDRVVGMLNTRAERLLPSIEADLVEAKKLADNQWGQLVRGTYVGKSLEEADRFVKQVDGQIKTLRREVPEFAPEEILAAKEFVPRDDATQLAQQIYDHAVQAEPPISTAVVDAVNGVGGRMDRFDSRIKQPDSLSRKLTGELDDKLRAKPFDSEAMAVASDNIKDSVRYTAVVPENGYWSKGDEIIKSMNDRGFKTIKDPGGWDLSGGYRGRNLAFEDANGTKFEVQVHTDASLKAASDTHKLYEEERLPTTLPTRKEELRRMQAAVFNKVPVPPGTLELMV